MKIQLILPTAGPYRSNSRFGSYTPLGLISMGTVVRQECPGVQVEILDGTILDHETIIQRLDGDIVGLNANTVTYPQAVEVAEAAKARGAYVVLGGVYASAATELILKHRKGLFDTMVVGYGERPMVDIINGRRSPLIINNTSEFDQLPLPDRGLVDLEGYIAAFQSNHPTWKYRATNIFTHVGCTWREQSNGGCIFCSRSGPSTAFRRPERVWEEIRGLVEGYGVDYVVDFSDTILQNTPWLREIVRARPPDLNPQWHIFARIDEITPENLDLVSHLPCRHIFVGMESGDRLVYGASRKGGGNPAQATEAARLMRDYGLELTPSYVIGLPGETRESLENTYAHACRIKEITQFEEIFCCELIPFPGSPAFGQLRMRFPAISDIQDIEKLKHDWAANFCTVDFGTMRRYVSRILALGEYSITIRRDVSTAISSKPCAEVDKATGLSAKRGDIRATG